MTSLYQAISDYVEENARIHKVSIRAVTQLVGVSRSGFKSWVNRKKSKQQQYKERVQIRIKEIYDKSKEIYGSPKITHILRQEGYKISQKTVSNYMREMGIKACYIKPWTKTTISKDFSTNLKNILKRDFNPKGPDAAWCTDITYIWTYTEGFVYLTSIMDLYSRKIIAWVLTKDMTAQSVLEVIKTAKQRRNIQQPLVIHSDRGIQFTSEEYRELTEKMKRSYSKKGTPWDNACIESFHAIIKREWLNRYKIWDYQQAKRLIFEYIETFYNTIRIHGHCDYLSPDEYEKEYYANQIKQLNLN
ncbi:IS3 family transposase [Thomasclavelia cocleata]|uniref:IS3 family transposase n=4 Tax=Thomasclavelia cocleata TaxID=69824 RepID=UPI00257069FB|nr:IS3 family transposase [Thomasclavelia cocleata]